MKIIRHWILLQTLQFLTRLPTRQDGVENRDKVYFGMSKSRVLPTLSSSSRETAVKKISISGFSFACNKYPPQFTDDKSNDSFAVLSLRKNGGLLVVYRFVVVA